MMRRHEPDYDGLPAEEFLEGRPEDPNEYRNLLVLWEEVEETAAEVKRALTESVMSVPSAVLELHLALSSYALRQGVFVNRVILEKYPGFCPYCQYQECICRKVAAGLTERNPIPPARNFITGHVRPETAQRMVIRIYGQANQESTIEQLCKGVSDEIREIQQWIEYWQANNQFLNEEEAKQFKFEIADAMARIYVLLDRLGIDIGDRLSAVGGGPPYRGTRKPKIKLATTYTPLTQLRD